MSTENIRFIIVSSKITGRLHFTGALRAGKVQALVRRSFFILDQPFRNAALDCRNAKQQAETQWRDDCPPPHRVKRQT